MTYHKLCLPLWLLLTPPVAAEERPPADAADHVWDLTLYYPDASAWEHERQALDAAAGTIGRWRGVLRTDPARLAAGLNEIADLRGRAARFAIYGSLTEMVDTLSEAARSRSEVGAELELRVESAVSFLAEEIAAVGEARLRHWLAKEPQLNRHRPRLERLLRELPHRLTTDAQAVVESAVRWPSGFQDLHSALLESDLGWRRIEVAEGGTVVADLAGYLQYRRLPDRALRARVTAAFFDRLGVVEELLGLLYTRRIEADLTLARHRKFTDGIAALWSLRDGMPVGSHARLTEALRELAPVARRYASLRARALAVTNPTYFDLFAAPPALTRRFSVSDSVELAAHALAPLGPETQCHVRELPAKPWFHLPMTPGKRRVYSNFVSMAGSPPMSIQPFESDYISARRLAGSLLWMTGQLRIPPGRGPETRDDPPTIGNGALYVANILFDDSYRTRSPDAGERIALLVASLDHLRRNFFDVAVLAALDERAQAQVKAGRTPTGSELSEIHLSVLRDLYGSGAGAAEVGVAEGRAWMAESVQFLSYEGQFWGAAMAAACQLVENLRRGDERALTAILDSTWDPDLYLSYPMLLRAGVDMATIDPYRAVGRRATALLDELERLLAARQ